MFTEKHYEKLLEKIDSLENAINSISVALPDGIATESKQDSIINTIKTKYDIIEEVKFTGELNGKPAKLFHILGRRTAFTSTSVFNDIGEGIGLASVANHRLLDGTQALSIASSQAADSVGGTGVKTVRITYIDNDDKLEQSPPIELNGTTPVPLGFTSKQILFLEAETVGTNGVAVGNIILTAAGIGAVMYIVAGGNRSLDAIFMVPINHTGYILDWEGSCILNSQDFRLRATVNTYDSTLTENVYKFIDNNYCNTDSRVEDSVHYFKLPALAKVKVSTVTSSTSANTRAEAGFTILIVEN